MKGLQALGFACSLGVAAATNQWMKPRLVYDFPAGEGTLATGTLWLADAGGRRELRLATWHVVAAELPRLMFKPIFVRELWLRSVEDEAGAAPDLELFVDFRGQEGQAVDAGTLNVASLRGIPLPILGVALGSEVQSRVRLPGSSAALPVASGHVNIERVFEVSRDETGSTVHVEGELQLVLLDEHGERTLSGGFSSRLRVP